MAYSDIGHRSGSTISERNFNYDQGIAIEAQLAGYALDRDPARLQRARDVGEAIVPAFWSDDLGSFKSGTRYPAGPHRLQRLDESRAPGPVPGRPQSALARVRAKERRRFVGAIAHRRMADMACAPTCASTRLAPGCETGKPRVVVEQTVDGAAQAWAQHLETALAEQLAAPAVETPPTVD